MMSLKVGRTTSTHASFGILAFHRTLLRVKKINYFKIEDNSTNWKLSIITVMEELCRKVCGSRNPNIKKYQEFISFLTLLDYHNSNARSKIQDFSSERSSSSIELSNDSLTRQVKLVVLEICEFQNLNL